MGDVGVSAVAKTESEGGRRGAGGTMRPASRTGSILDNFLRKTSAGLGVGSGVLSQGGLWNKQIKRHCHISSCFLVRLRVNLYLLYSLSSGQFLLSLTWCTVGAPNILPTKELSPLPFESSETVPQPQRMHFQMPRMYLELKWRESGVGWGEEEGAGTRVRCRLPFLDTLLSHHAIPVAESPRCARPIMT